MEEKVILRQLELEDYHKGFIECLSHLTKTGNISFQAFKNRFELLKTQKNYTIIVAVLEDKIIGAGTLFVEYKFIRGCAKKGHIEDIVVNKNYQGMGIGKKIVNSLVLISKNKGCYKTALCCAEKNIGFYEKTGFEKNEVEMTIYHKK